MAVPPTVPTSFVPRSSPSPFRSAHFDFGGAFAFIGYGALALALLMVGLVFAYSWYLGGQEAAKRDQLKQAESSIDSATVQSFVHLHDGLSEGERLLNAHVVFSGVFDVLESLTPTTIRLSSLHVSITDAHTGVLTSSGTAASFNSLASLSAILAKDSHIKNAIFSGIAVEKAGGVSFSLTADLDPTVIAYTVSGGASVTPPPQTGTP